ncbi:hypothetical protein Btru_061076 [Bulinus truncatus]|nr:hypothetical protein Btru_061076 [Bulinus truncatus]
MTCYRYSPDTGHWEINNKYDTQRNNKHSDVFGYASLRNAASLLFTSHKYTRVIQINSQGSPRPIDSQRMKQGLVTTFQREIKRYFQIKWSTSVVFLLEDFSHTTEAVDCIHSPRLKSTDGDCIHSPRLKSTDGDCIHSPRLKSTDGDCIHSQGLKSTDGDCIHSPRLKSTDGDCIHSLRLKSTDGDCIRSQRLNSTDGDCIDSQRLNSTDGDCIHSPRLNSTDGDCIDSQRLNSTDGDCIRSQRLNSTDGDCIRSQRLNSTDGDCIDSQRLNSTDGDCIRSQRFNSTDGDCIDNQRLNSTDGDCIRSQRLNSTDGDCIDSQRLNSTDGDCIRSQRLNSTDGDCIDSQRLNSADGDCIDSQRLNSTDGDCIDSQRLNSTDGDCIDSQRLNSTDGDCIDSQRLNSTYGDCIDSQRLNSTDGDCIRSQRLNSTDVVNQIFKEIKVKDSMHVVLDHIANLLLTLGIICKIRCHEITHRFIETLTKMLNLKHGATNLNNMKSSAKYEDNSYHEIDDTDNQLYNQEPKHSSIFHWIFDRFIPVTPSDFLLYPVTSVRSRRRSFISLTERRGQRKFFKRLALAGFRYDRSSLSVICEYCDKVECLDNFNTNPESPNFHNGNCIIPRGSNHTPNPQVFHEIQINNNDDELAEKYTQNSLINSESKLMKLNATLEINSSGAINLDFKNKGITSYSGAKNEAVKHSGKKSEHFDTEVDGTPFHVCEVTDTNVDVTPFYSGRATDTKVDVTPFYGCESIEDETHSGAKNEFNILTEAFYKNLSINENPEEDSLTVDEFQNELTVGECQFLDLNNLQDFWEKNISLDENLYDSGGSTDTLTGELKSEVTTIDETIPDYNRSRRSSSSGYQSLDSESRFDVLFHEGEYEPGQTDRNELSLDKKAECTTEFIDSDLHFESIRFNSERDINQCLRNPYHLNFTPVESLSLQSLPKKLRCQEILRMLELLSLLTVKTELRNIIQMLPTQVKHVLTTKVLMISLLHGGHKVISYGSSTVLKYHLVEYQDESDGQTRFRLEKVTDIAKAMRNKDSVKKMLMYSADACPGSCGAPVIRFRSETTESAGRVTYHLDTWIHHGYHKDEDLNVSCIKECTDEDFYDWHWAQQCNSGQGDRLVRSQVQSAAQQLFNPQVDRPLTSHNEAAEVSHPPATVSVIEHPSYPAYITFNQRLQSYANWLSNNIHTPIQLAEGGFFYAGYSDCVRCFCCGLGLRSWKPGDDIYVEHERYRPTCSFLRQHLLSNTSLWQQRDHVTRSDNSNVNANLKFNTAANADSDEPSPRKYLETLVHNIQVPAVCATVCTASAEQSNVTTDSYQALNSTLDLLKHENEALQAMTKCKVCQVKASNILFLPCGELYACTECADKVTHCPSCGQRILGTVKTYFS